MTKKTFSKSNAIMTNKNCLFMQAIKSHIKFYSMSLYF